MSWDIEDPFEEKIRAYNAPITEHTCDKGCKMMPEVHERAEIWDDFELSQRKREIIDMEVIQSKGRELKERLILRRFKSTREDDPEPYVLRLETVNKPTKETMGDLRFETQEESDEYYNYCLKAFRFTEVSPIVPETNGWGFDEDGEGTAGWDIEDDEETTSGWW